MEKEARAFKLINAVITALLVLAGGAAHAQAYPSKPVRLVVPVPPGGTMDLMGRLIATKVQEAWGQPVIVENRPGASGTVGVDHVAKSAPDGYTLVHNSTPIVTTPHLRKLPYDLSRDIVAVAQIAEIEYVLAASSKSGLTSVHDMIASARQNPGKLNYASAGNGSGQHLYMELVKGAAKINITHVPYKGNGPALQALLAGEVDLMFDTSAGVILQAKSGKLRPIMVAGGKRLESLPDVPSYDEVFPGTGTGIDAWHGWFAPAGTPKAVLDRIAAEVQRAVHLPDVARRLRELGFIPTGLGSERFDAIVRRDLERWGQVIRENNIKAD